MAKSERDEAIDRLLQQLESLHQIVETIPHRIKGALGPILQAQHSDGSVENACHEEARHPSARERNQEEESANRGTGEITPEAQVQLLKTHLTAANRRISELEAQLLSRRPKDKPPRN